MHSNPDQLFISELTLESTDNHSRKIIPERKFFFQIQLIIIYICNKVINILDLCNSILAFLF